MKTIFAAIGILLVATFAGTAGTAAAAELRGIHRYGFWRIWPQDCFLMPDVAVAVHALGPYCSSPRGFYRARYDRRWAWSDVVRPGYVPYYGYYRPWGWSDLNRP